MINKLTPDGNRPVTVTFQWNCAEEGGTCSRSNTSPWRHNGTIWVLDGTFAGLSGSDPYIQTVEMTGTVSGNWTIANADGALPVQLSNFTAVMAGEHKVHLRWSTISETNNYGFEVQKSTKSSEGYVTIENSFVPGHGTTLKPQEYSFVDETAQPGVWYYRLKQMDLDGTAHYSDGVQVSMVMGVGEMAPIAFALKQNYPNPFNPETQIKFSVEQAGRATLRVYNALGQELATLFDGMAEAGQHYTVKLNGMGLASGMYFYKLDSGTRNDLKRMLLLK